MQPTNSLKTSITIFAGLLFICCTVNSRAQSLGDPVVNITFGSGTASHAGALAADSGSTSYTYSSADFPNDGSYTIENRTNSPNVWWTTTDHTGNTGGYMMVVNASVSKTDYFYKREVKGLCGQTTYQFGAWVGNLLRSSDISPPNITFSIAETNGTIIQSYNTGTIALTTGSFKWVQYVFNFTLPAGVSDVIIQMTNNSNGGAPANDLALDDITFRPYGPSVVASFGSASSGVTTLSSCAGTDQSYTFSVPDVTGYTSPAYQWQVNTGSGWVDIAGATTSSYTVSYKPAVAGTYRYRVATGEVSNIGSSSCRVVSNELTLTINVASVPTATVTTPACTGGTITLSASSGASYQWTGPDGFTSAQQSPVLSNLTTAASGTYQVNITSAGNCVTTATVNVVVNPVPVAKVSASATTVCQGETVALNASGGSTYKWTPAAGLSDANVANPSFTATETVKYLVTVGNTSGCTDTTSITVSVNKTPTAGAGTDKQIVQGQSVSLKGTATGGDVSYYWTPSDYLSDSNVLNPVATPPADITYTLHVMSSIGCGTATDDVFIRVYKQVTIPNTFTPNGDGVNDTWNIGALDSYPTSVTRVFDRYGAAVFSSIGYPKAWDGKYNDRNVPAGTYYYVIDLMNGQRLSGWVLIVR